MANFKEEIEAIKAQITALENNLVCDCGKCDEDEGPDLWVGFSEPTATFTKAELVAFATKLVKRAVETCKAAIKEVEFESESCCDVSLGFDRQIEVEIDNSMISSVLSDTIDDALYLDKDSVEEEVDNILAIMIIDKQKEQ